MLKSKHIDRLCDLDMMLALALTGLLIYGETLGLQPVSNAPE